MKKCSSSESEALLTGLKQESLSKFEKEALNVGDDGGLQVRSRVATSLSKAEELKHGGL